MHPIVAALTAAILAISPSAAVDSRVTRQRKKQLRRRQMAHAAAEKRDVKDEDAAFWAQMMKFRELQGGSLPPTPAVTPFPTAPPVTASTPFPTVASDTASPTIIATFPFESTPAPTGVFTPFPTAGGTGEEVGLLRRSVLGCLTRLNHRVFLFVSSTAHVHLSTT